MNNTQQNIFETQPNENNELPQVLIRATNPTIEEAAPKKTRNQKDKMNQYIKRQLNDNLNDLMEDIISENKRLRKEIEKIRNMYNQEMKTNEEIRNGLLEQRLEFMEFDNFEDDDTNEYREEYEEEDDDDDIGEEEIDKEIKERLIHRQIFFYYNSFNIINGKQGAGKTTIIMKELAKLNKIEHQYEAIIYVSQNAGDDETFNQLKGLIKTPIYGMNYEKFMPALMQYYKQPQEKHLIIILEDATFALMKEDKTWGEIITRLRHLKTTIIMAMHI
ncbi:hypothetical protein CL6EHI_145450 [Entamoeba histolytica]|uniref:Uncharacterized protein n=3 Tax=Entamoeba histolytica TaxID=5759 RepID=C4M6E7_ENTH1|nr:hypothetical protein EHI_145450 [Entamoeba histolytica HM-1:IMSS]EAL47435.1 hypothetical protein EHI_145450 [Entamoeba histolytica HM-1:IMSS]EMD48958.1 Hypothetical protein EHI5A_118560 [Entamoeba histolytica KU27]GAT97055.1 hypothetical protein CL6EHI_145450 [Entamoeba histolytica]|eukprot:XP_652821.1 hypothetical protein EHI_145450 [Entamoeba histolytica HM-1:IMSS]